MKKGLGRQEFALLRWIAQRGEVSVGDAAASFGAPRGLARSTVLTMMERLRAKRRLRRRRGDGVYLYGSTEAPESVLRGLVHDFVETTLDGSISPFVAYLTETGKLTEEELAELDELVAKLQSRRGRSQS